MFDQKIIKKNKVVIFLFPRKTEIYCLIGELRGEVCKEDETVGLATVEEVATVTARNTMGTLLLCSQEICDGSGPGNEGFTSNCFAPHQ